MPQPRYSTRILQFTALGIGLAALSHDTLAAISQTALWPADFASYYVPARAVIEYPGTNVYDYSALLHLNAAHHYVSGVFYPYIYPPVALLALRGLAMLPFGAANAIWVLLSHLCAIGSAALLADAFATLVRRLAAEGSAGSRAALDVLRTTNLRIGRWSFPLVPFACASVVLLVAWPAWDTYYWGQINFVVVFLLAMAFDAHMRDKPVLAGVAIALAGALKLTPLFFVAYLVARGAWKAAASAIAVSAALAAIPLLFFPAENYAHMVVELRVLDGMFVLGNHNESFIGMFARIVALMGHGGMRGQVAAETVGEVVAGAIAALTLIAVAVASFGPLRRGQPLRLKQPRRDVVTSWLGFGAAQATYVLVTPLVWSHFYVVVLPCALILFGYLAVNDSQRSNASSRPAVVYTVVALAICGLGILMSQLPLGADAGVEPVPDTATILLLCTRALATLVLWAAIMLVWRAHSAAAPGSAEIDGTPSAHRASAASFAENSDGSGGPAYWSESPDSKKAKIPARPTPARSAD